MSDYHNRMMNIQVDAASMAEAGKPRSLRFAYKYGHRDARHAAAEIANEVDAEIARLREALGSVVEAADTAPPIHVIAYISRAVEKARAALAQAAEVGNG